MYITNNNKKNEEETVISVKKQSVSCHTESSGNVILQIFTVNYKMTFLLPKIVNLILHVHGMSYWNLPKKQLTRFYSF